MMPQRYFIKTDKADAPLTLFRFSIDDSTEQIFEQEWQNGWEDTARLGGYLISGDPRIVEIPREKAEELFPDSVTAENATLVSKQVAERMFTLGPMYIPNVKDAHAEWTDPEELQKAVWEYVKKGDRRIRLQHDKSVVAGEWLEIMAWPYEVEAPIIMKDASQGSMKFPANTVFLGVKWEPWAWQMIKEGKLRGYSIGGRAERLLADLPEEYVGKAQAPFEDAIRVEADDVAPPPIVAEADLEDRIALAVAEAMKSINPVVNVVMPEEKPKVRRVERDENGNILRVIEE
jgi:hypothetical protein